MRHTAFSFQRASPKRNNAPCFMLLAPRSMLLASVSLLFHLPHALRPSSRFMVAADAAPTNSTLRFTLYALRFTHYFRNRNRLLGINLHQQPAHLVSRIQVVSAREQKPLEVLLVSRFHKGSSNNG